MTLHQHVNDKNDPHETLKKAKQARYVGSYPEDLSAFNDGDLVAVLSTGRMYFVSVNDDAEEGESSASLVPFTPISVPAPDSSKADKAVPSAAGNLAALDISGNLVDSGAKPVDFAPAGVVSTLVGGDSGKSVRTIASEEAASAAQAIIGAGTPEAFDTLKEIADWIADDQSGAAKIVSDVSSLQSNKVDKVPGKGLSTNDYDAAEKGKVASALQPADLADPLIVTQTGKVADAKATGDALAWKRGVMDLGVRGAPTIADGAAVGKFYVDGVECTFDSSRSVWKTGDDYEGCEIDIVNASPLTYRIVDFADMSGEPPVAPVESFTLSAANGYAVTVLGYVIVGYGVDTLAKTSQIPAAPYATPQMDGTASVGSSGAFARADHVHPTDTSRASTNDVALTPVYGGNGNALSDQWSLEGLPDDVVVVDGPRWTPLEFWTFQFRRSNGIEYFTDVFDSSSAESLTLNCIPLPPVTPEDDVGNIIVTATRLHNPLVGYTLGSQTGKPLQPKGDYAPATNIQKAALASDVQTSLGKADTAVQPAALAGAVRYDLVQTITLGQLEDHAVQKVELVAASTTLVLPALTDLTGKVADFGIDVVNSYEDSGTPAAASFQLSGTIGTDYNLIVPKGETWSDMTALAAGEMAVYYFTRSAFQNDDVPTWEVMKKVVEFVPVPTEP